MVKIIPIQVNNRLNDVLAVDEKGNDNAHHVYEIKWDSDNNGYISTQGIRFQNGGRNIKGSEHGVTNEDLLEICRHRLQCFQTSEYACRENALALTNIEEALMWLNHRVTDRANRNVLGINSK